VGVQQLSRLLEQSGTGSGFDGATSLILTVSTNMLIDGLLIGVAFLSAPKTGVIITIALAVETLFLGVAAVAILPDGLPIYRKLALPLLFGVLLLVGVTAGTVVFAGLGTAPIAVVLAFGAANLIYLVTEELLVKAQKVPETPVSTTLFFLGFLGIFVFDMFY
jgi:ZIP family zinc transporter